MTGDVSHLDDEGNARMVDISSKAVTRRAATATATVQMSPATARLLAEGDLPKGDALAVARVAGIMGAKQTPALIPLCHPISLTSVDITIDVDVPGGAATVTVTAATHDRTGVEMEALTACTVAALTIYDMCKSIDKDMAVGELRLWEKVGGRAGHWRREQDNGA